MGEPTDKAHGRGGCEAGPADLEGSGAGGRRQATRAWRQRRADKEEKAARAEPASGSKDKPGDSSGSTERPSGDPYEGTKQSVDVGKQKSQDFECWDLRSSMKEMSDDQLKKVAFLFLSRIYSVFDPQKQGKVPELIAKYEMDLRTLVGAVAAKYLDQAQSQSLFESLRDSVMGRKRTELGWETDVEEANRSLDLALAYMEADDEEDAAKKKKLKEALEESRKKKSESERDRTSLRGRLQTQATAPGLRLGSLRERKQTKAKESATKEKEKEKERVCRKERKETQAGPSGAERGRVEAAPADGPLSARCGGRPQESPGRWRRHGF